MADKFKEMSDRVESFDSAVLSGAAILLSFFVGYKYGMRGTGSPDQEKPKSSAATASNDESSTVSIHRLFKLKCQIGKDKTNDQYP